VAEAPRRPQLTQPDAPDARAVLAAYGLPGSPIRMTAVAGAWSNRVYRLEASGGVYAVKELRNPWDEPRFAQRLAEAWSFERAAIAAGVAAPEPIAPPGSDGCTAAVARAGGGDHATVRVHRWAEGGSAPAGPVADPVADWAGRTLATLHGLGVRAADRSLFPALSTATAERWPELAEAAERARAPWAGLVRAAAPGVETIADLARADRTRPDEEVMAHADVDGKNLILGPAGPLLCDWDVATPLVPRGELADAALSLGGWRDLAVARRVVRAYRSAGGRVEELAPPDLARSLTSSLDWIALNVEAAIGLRAASADRRRLAVELVPALLRSLPREVGVALDVRTALTV
jgi:Phosphotransferase enzyme family